MRVLTGSYLLVFASDVMTVDLELKKKLIQLLITRSIPSLYKLPVTDRASGNCTLL